jgi:hypothetical protein
VDGTLLGYFAAWNETDADERRRLLERSVSAGVELVDPTGRWQGFDELSARIANYHAVAPGTTVIPASGVTRTTVLSATPGRLSILAAMTSWRVSTSPSETPTDACSAS